MRWWKSNIHQPRPKHFLQKAWSVRKLHLYCINLFYFVGYMKCAGIKVHFLPINCVPDLSKKSKYNKLFDVIYFSNRYVITCAVVVLGHGGIFFKE